MKVNSTGSEAQSTVISTLIKCLFCHMHEEMQSFSSALSLLNTMRAAIKIYTLQVMQMIFTFEI